VLEKQLFDPQQGKSNKHVNIFFSFLLAQMVLSLFNSMQAYTFLFMIRIFFSYYKKHVGKAYKFIFNQKNIRPTAKRWSNNLVFSYILGNLWLLYWDRRDGDREDGGEIMLGSNVHNKITVSISCLVMMNKTG